MILQRLYELSLREGLLDNLAFEEQPIPFVIKLGESGKYLGLEERRGETQSQGKNRGTDPKKVPDKGKVVSIPRPHGNTANQGFARFFADTLPRVLPVTEDEKSSRSRRTFWQQIDRAAEETDDPALKAVQGFGMALAGDTDLMAAIRSDVEQLKPGVNDRCTFAWEPDRGKTILDREPIRSWYRQFFQAVTDQRQQKGPTGICQISGQIGPIPTTHPIKLNGIPGGLPTGVSIASYDKPAFGSYGLEGTANAAIGYSGADGYTRALQALIAGKLKGRPTSNLRIGATLFLFWTREPVETNFMALLDNPNPQEVEHLFRSASAGRQSFALDDPNAFYLLGMSGNSARAIVREYLEAPLPLVRDNLVKWFHDLTIALATEEGAGKPSNRFPLTQLAVATALGEKQIAPDVSARLMHAALKGEPIPDSILAACLRRLRAKGKSGFWPPRMALIKISLLRRKISVSETLDPGESHTAYVYGRLLAVCDEIQRAALGRVNTSVVDRFYGRFSTAPALVLRRLVDGAIDHLKKIRGDNPRFSDHLERRLVGILALAPATPLGGQLTLEEQARFTLGFYHQKAKRFEEIAERKAAKAKALDNPA